MAEPDPHQSLQCPVLDTPILHRRTFRAVGCGILAFLATWLTLDDPGLVWDEAIYLGFASRYIEWFRHWGDGAFSREAIELTWGKGQVHPPLGKLGLAAGIKLFHPTFPLCPELDLRAIRVASAGYFGLMVGVAFWWMATAFGTRAGVLAALAIVLTPRLFAHAHFGTLEMPMTVLWFVTVALASQIERSRKWLWPTAIALGLAGLTKINAGFIPFVLIPYLAWRLRRKSVVPLVALVVIPTLMFFLLWPHLWVAPWRHLCSYISDKASRMHIETYYLGRAFAKSSPPWHYPVVLTLVTVPLPFLGAAVSSTVRGVRRRDPSVVLLVANAALVLAVACLPFVPRYDGVRLFLPAFPFIACLAGLGLSQLVGYLQQRMHRQRAAWAVCVCLLALPAAEIVHLHPFQLSYYNEATGFLAGAEAMGFEPTYWWDTFSGETVQFLNRTCEPDAKVAFCKVDPYVPEASRTVIKTLRSDLKLVDFEAGDWDYLVLVSRYGKFDDRAWEIHREQEPMLSVARWGVKLCSVYRRR